MQNAQSTSVVILGQVVQVTVDVSNT